jgi:hypothetical protein
LSLTTTIAKIDQFFYLTTISPHSSINRGGLYIFFFFDLKPE